MPIAGAAAGSREADATADPDHQKRSNDSRYRRGISLEVLTSGLVAAALAALLFVGAHGASDGATWRLAAGAVVAFVVIVVAVRRFVFSPIRRLVKRSRKRLGSDLARSDPQYRNETRELSYLVDVLIAAFTSGDHKEWVSQGVREELERADGVGIDGYITKPFRIAHVLSVVEKYLSH